MRMLGRGTDLFIDKDCLASRSVNSRMDKCPVCGKVGTLKCSGCKGVSYCSKDHQVVHWKQHKIKCRPFEVQKNNELGRHLVATRDITCGTLLISESPIVVGPKSSTDPLCLGCYQPVDPDTCSRCPACEWPACDPNCSALTSQDHHLPECIILSLNPQPVRVGKINYDAILPLRCLLLQKRSPKKWKQFLSLESHFKDRDKTTEVYKEVDEKIVKYLKTNYLALLDSDLLQNTSDKIIHIICGIIEVNGLEISTGDGDVTALYSNASLMEHNCLPNVKYKFNLQDFKIAVESAVDIKCTMYTHTLWGTAARRDHLIRTKYFFCKCRRCSDPTELSTYFSSLKCISSSTSDVTEPCKGIVTAATGEENSDWYCSECPLVLSSVHVSDLVSRLGAEVDSVMEDPSVAKLEKLLSNLEKLLHPNHYHCFTVAHSLIQLWGREPRFQLHHLSESQLDQKIDFCKRLLEIIKILDPTGTRTSLYSGVCLLEKSLALEELARRNEKPAFKEKALREARDNLEVAKDQLDNTGPAVSLGIVIRATYVRLLEEWKKYQIIEIP